MITVKNVDLSNCDREQIQFSNAIQPHAGVVVFDQANQKIVQVSANIEEILASPVDSLIGKTIEEAAPGITPLLSRLKQADTTNRQIHLGEWIYQGRDYVIFGHEMGAYTIVEFEFIVDPESYPDSRALADLQSNVRLVLQRLERTEGLQPLLDEAAKAIQALTGFDRVMIYKFHHDGSGEVRAEAVSEGLEPYLGLHYPATDIPQPARRLFAMTWLRHLPDVNYVPIPLVPELNPLNGEFTDLSVVASRSVSVMYTRYLQNMGVHATMVMTLLRDGKLWGLVSCMHHQAPRLIPHSIRMACEFVAHMLSMLLAAKESAEFYEYQLESQSVREKLVNRMLMDQVPISALLKGRPNVMDMTKCSGAAVISRSEIFTTGQTPHQQQIRELWSWLVERGDSIYVTDRLCEHFPPAQEYMETASGLISARVSRLRPEYILWFRPEVITTVNWAGDPTKPVEVEEVSGVAQLSPRQSFSLWKQDVHGMSRPWLDCEIASIDKLRTDLIEIVAAGVEELERVNTELNFRNQELDSFANAASHDLKTPLRAIHTSSELLRRSLEGRMTENEQRRLTTIQKLAIRMNELIDALLQLSRTGRIEVIREPIDLQELVQELGELVRGVYPLAQIEVATPLPTVDADHALTRSIFQNLLVNAAKYTRDRLPLIRIGHAGDNGEPIFFVRDNGIGIDPKHHTQIFRLFHRLHSEQDFGGGEGAGLALVKAAVERHGGKIWLESKLGEGSVFYFTLGQRR